MLVMAKFSALSFDVGEKTDFCEETGKMGKGFVRQWEGSRCWL